ncbi:hypothetical protein EVJ32_04865 [Exiguobacterium sp. SH5S4]|uniref:hypothetical protein n=1 Tax=Exiguobacterium sp. SH5S4 TaxID=2510961 RepID=UPI001040D4E5|nr:hypothetical protein [Exiguobacterium sp. SH5S4]TCI26708.1 hypothetical protein EVJ32_04865 [Exiguobacterium sp. SH5S4]
MKKYIIEDKMSVQGLMDELGRMDELHAGKLVRHVKTKGVYRISHFSVLNQNGGSELAVNYHPFVEVGGYDITSVRHTRSCEEFFDGRFEF